MSNVPDTVNKVLDELARRFGTTGAALWAAYVHYIQLYALGWMLAGLFAAGLMFIGSYRLKADEYDTDTEVIRWIGMIGAIILAFFFIGVNFADLFAPQGAAIMYILH